MQRCPNQGSSHSEMHSEPIPLFRRHWCRRLHDLEVWSSQHPGGGELAFLMWTGNVDVLRSRFSGEHWGRPREGPRRFPPATRPTRITTQGHFRGKLVSHVRCLGFARYRVHSDNGSSGGISVAELGHQSCPLEHSNGKSGSHTKAVSYILSPNILSQGL